MNGFELRAGKRLAKWPRPRQRKSNPEKGMSNAEPLPTVSETLAQYGIVHEVLACDPDLADTAAFCEHYGYSPAQSANTIVVASRKIEPPKHGELITHNYSLACTYVKDRYATPTCPCFKSFFVNEKLEALVSKDTCSSGIKFISIHMFHNIFDTICKRSYYNSNPKANHPLNKVINNYQYHTRY